MSAPQALFLNFFKYVLHIFQVTHCIRVANNSVKLFRDGVEVECDTSQFHSVLEASEHLLSIHPCPGITDPSLQVMKGQDFYQSQIYDAQHNKQCSWLRSKSCLGQAEVGSLCTSCQRVQATLLRRKRRRMTGIPKNKAPLKKLSKKRLRKALQAAKKEKKVLQTKLDSTKAVEVAGPLHESLLGIVSTTKLEQVPPHVKLFWQEQVSNLQRNTKGKRWNPVMIRLALMIHSQSPQVYRTLRSTGLLQLPGETTLRDYSSACTPSQGFQPDVGIVDLL